jgi:hypothetical protein
MLWREMELEAAQDAMGFGRGEGLVEGPGEWVNRLSSTTRIRSALG